MLFNTSEMPKSINADSIYFGLSHDESTIRNATPVERNGILQLRRNRRSVKVLAENYFSCFSDRLFGEAFQNKLTKNKDATAFLFSIFSKMLSPLSGTMIHGDMRNQGTRNFISEYISLNASDPKLDSMYCSFPPNSDKHNAKFNEVTGNLIIHLLSDIKEFDLTHNHIAVCFASAFITVHPTIQQNFMRSLYQTAAVLGRNHLEEGIEIKSKALLKIISDFSQIKSACFPYI